MHVCIHKYLEEHKSNYHGKYRCHSCVQTDKFEHKFRYYIRDIQFREISIYLTLDYSQSKIKTLFSVDLHEQEEEYIIKDALKQILYFNEYRTVLQCNEFQDYIDNKKTIVSLLEPLDYRNILDYLEYHKGINQETVDEFYNFFMPYLKKLLEIGNYRKFIDAVNLLLDKILYEYEWDGITAKYLDTQYQFHLYYFRKIIEMVFEQLDIFYDQVKESLLEAIWRLCNSQRFAFAIMTDFGNLVLSHYRVTKAIFKYIDSYLKDQNETNIVVAYLKAIFESNHEAFKEASMDVIRFVMNDMLTFANHDLQLAIGNSIVKSEGYDLLISLFSKDYNTFVFVCFPISTFPQEYHDKIKEELEKAIRFYAGRMEHDEYRLSSFEQVSNINRLLMENYKEYGKNG